jgi:hypothetical protein
MIDIKQILYGLVLLTWVVLGTWIYSLRGTVTNLTMELQTLKENVVRKDLELSICSTSIDTQNKAIEDIKVDLNATLFELEEWKAKPAIIRYKIIEKIIKVKSNECKDINDTLNSVKLIDFNSL